jgi:hypothetical protein
MDSTYRCDAEPEAAVLPVLSLPPFDKTQPTGCCVGEPKDRTKLRFEKTNAYLGTYVRYLGRHTKKVPI